uniref:G-protein coupled receptors family 1 profile domain-containing protein n=1 Tax=Romanomermis culicivorax TaxID=13658 RepID=A0A915HSE2_ROMCU
MGRFGAATSVPPFRKWYFGDFLCKLSVWINATTVCASVYTLVAVSADRYFAICHTMKYSTLEPTKTLFIIFPIWLISGLLFTPYYTYFCEVTIYPGGVPIRACLPLFPSDEVNRSFFLVANLFLAFVLPLLAIMLCYLYIYCAVARRPVSAVDKNAHERERRVKIKVTHMMVTVVALFAASWLPFYVFFAYVMFDESVMSWIGAQVLRAVLQWCTLANSCINPILYAYFSRKFRRAFQEILILPCRQRYQRLRNHRCALWKGYFEAGKKAL